jgi:hypothetical protein
VTYLILQPGVKRWLRWQWQRLWRDVLFSLGMIAGLVVLAATSMVVAESRAERIELQGRQRMNEVLRVAPPLDQRVPPRGVHEQLKPMTEYAEQLQSLYDLAEQHGLMPASAEYRWRQHPDPGVAQLSIAMPLRGDYAKLQGFVAAALYQQPNLGIETLQLQRLKVEDSELDIRLGLVLYLRREASR